MSRRIVITLFLAAILLAAPFQEVGAQGSVVTLSGEVLNGTSGGETPGELEVSLILLREGVPIDTLTAMADAEGAFEFPEVEYDEGDEYLLRATYADVIYTAGPLPLEAGEPEQVGSLTVYETTTDQSNIIVNRAHLFASPMGDGLFVTEFYMFANSGDRTYVGTEEIDGQRWVSQFVLPAGSRDLVLDDGSLGGRFLATADGFVDREPLWPGNTSVMFRYRLDCPNGVCSLSRDITQSITSMNLLVPDVGVGVTAPKFLPQEKVTSQDGVYLNYITAHLVPGQALDLQINLRGDDGQLAAKSGGDMPWPWVLLGVVAVVGALGYPFWRQRIPSRQRGHSSRE